MNDAANDATRRRFLRACVALPGLAFPACRAASASEPVDAPKLRRAGDVDDTAAITRALSLDRPVRLPAGGGSGSGGDYIVDMLDLPDGATITGQGAATIVRSSSARIPHVIHIDSTRTTTHKLTLRDMTIRGHVARSGFSEHHHLVSLTGVTNCLVENVAFEGFAGDGLYLGAEREGLARSARQNAHVTVRGCTFDGINNDNRNGISVTGGSDITIEDCRFVRCTRPDMPGPIDFEADAFPFYVFERISVRGCTFEECGGNVGQISVVTPSVVQRLPRGVTIANNRFSNYRGSGSDIAILVHRRATAAMPPMDVLIEDNVGTDGRAGMRLYSGRGMIVRGNQWTRYLGQSFVGYAGADDGCRDVSIADRFDHCGTVDGIALGIYNAAVVDIAGSSFISCGDGTARSACILLGPGQSDGIALTNNDFRSNSRDFTAIRRGAEHVLTGPLAIGPGNLILPGQALKR